MIAYPNAKINLGLNVIRKRPDGFHDIESVFFPIPWKDILEIVPEKKGRGQATFSSSGIPIPHQGEPNLCERVYVLMHRELNLPSVKMHLHKVVPIGAGMGGGSADAAFAASTLNKLFSLNLSDEKLEQIVAQVGSDCPFFIRNKAAFVTGRGDILEPFEINLSGFWIMIVNPNIHIGTKEAYSGVRPSPSSVDLRAILTEHPSKWKDRLRNDFEDSVFPTHPVLPQLKSKFYTRGALYAAMTGSGSTVFGLFENEPEPIEKEKYQLKIARL